MAHKQWLTMEVFTLCSLIAPKQRNSFFKANDIRQHRCCSGLFKHLHPVLHCDISPIPSISDSNFAYPIRGLMSLILTSNVQQLVSTSDEHGHTSCLLLLFNSLFTCSRNMANFGWGRRVCDVRKSKPMFWSG